MNELKQLLDDKLGWLVNTTGAKHVSVKLDANQLARIMNALREAENNSPDLPEIEPRMLGQQEPRGTKRSQEEIRAILQATHGGGNPYNSGGYKVLA